jgi:hypothetical protein
MIDIGVAVVNQFSDAKASKSAGDLGFSDRSAGAAGPVPLGWPPGRPIVQVP